MVRSTSIKTYNDIINEGLVHGMQEEVMREIKKTPNMTDSEIAHNLGYGDMNKTRPRRRELVEMGIVIENGKRRCTITDRTVFQWKIVDEIEYKQINKLELSPTEMVRILKLIKKADENQLELIKTKIEHLQKKEKIPSSQQTLNW